MQFSIAETPTPWILRTVTAPLQLHLRDLSAPLVTAWRRAFAGVADVTISEGDIFSERPGPLAADAPIDLEADAVVSPANSFGFMDGGIDLVYSHVLGSGLQDRLQRVLADAHGGELPVGQAVIVATDHPQLPWCVSAPTMRVPQDVSDTVNAYLAFRAALHAVLAHRDRLRPIRRLLCPGLATAVGGMPPERCARQMRTAWDRVVGGDRFVPRSIRAAMADHAALLGD